jgi:TRAP-type C4-dicarboxylate transport system permease small subunit
VLKTLDGINAGIDRVLQVLIAVLAVIVVAINLAQIVGRTVFFYSIPWSEELSTYMYVWIIFLSLHMLTREKAELTIDVLKFKDKRAEFTVKIIRDIIVMITVIILFIASVMMIQNALRFPRKTASLGITTAPLNLCMPISFALVLFQRCTNFLHHARELTSRG